MKKEELKRLGILFGANIYTDEKDVERINLILDHIEGYRRTAEKIELEQSLKNFTKKMS